MNGTASLFDAGTLADRLCDATVEVRTPRGHGAGVRWPVAGLVATCSHVVAGTVAAIGFRDGSESRARIVLDEPESDIALLLLDTPGAPGALEIRPEPLRPGELLFAMGNPWGEARVLTAGIAIGSPGDSRFVAADLRVMPGNSGGPLIDSHGRLAGVISMYRGGAAIAVAALEVERIAARLRAPAAAA